MRIYEFHNFIKFQILYIYIYICFLNIFELFFEFRYVILSLKDKNLEIIFNIFIFRIIQLEYLYFFPINFFNLYIIYINIFDDFFEKLNFGEKKYIY